MLLRNIENYSPTRSPSKRNKNKIEHQIDNEGCKCDLCQKIAINQMKVIKTYHIQDKESELTKGKRQEFFSKFLIEYNSIDKMNRKVKVIFPEVCVFQKGVPICLLTKKRQTLPVKMIKNKQKLNGFEIHNFFVDGFTFHNNFKERIASQNRNKDLKQNTNGAKLRKDYYSFDQALKSQCIVLAKFYNGSCQMITPVELTNLFKSKQRQLRQQIIYLSTMVCTMNYNEIRVTVNLDHLHGTKILERAKNEVKMINEDIKPKDFQFIPQREQRKYQEQLKDEDPQRFLEYISLKLTLLYSLKTDILFRDALFKFVKDQIDSYYLVDVQVYSKSSAHRLWGNYDNNKAFQESPEKKKVRPTSSPERMQKQRNLKDKVYDVPDFVIDIK